jgi:hypothetical protein
MLKNPANVLEVIGRWLLGIAEWFELIVEKLYYFGEYLIKARLDTIRVNNGINVKNVELIIGMTSGDGPKCGSGAGADPGSDK